MNYRADAYGRYHGTVKTTNVVVSGTGVTLLPPNPQEDRRDFIIYNGSTATIYVGGSNVTAANGLPVASGTSFSVPAGRANIYAVTAAGTAPAVRVMEIS